MPDTHSSDDKARWLFSGECAFKIGATKDEHIPKSSLNEVAFCGLSNVGKSTLINSLTGRKSLARTSSTPGHTRQINFFLLREHIMLVDLPGYGYAKAPKSQIASWQRLLKNYLKGRVNLVRVYLLIDARRGVKSSDTEIMQMLDDCAVSYQIVLTKIDKAKNSGIDTVISDIKRSFSKHAALYPEIIATSSVNKKGIDLLKVEIAKTI